MAKLTVDTSNTWDQLVGETYGDTTGETLLETEKWKDPEAPASTTPTQVTGEWGDLVDAIAQAVWRKLFPTLNVDHPTGAGSHHALRVAVDGVNAFYLSTTATGELVLSVDNVGTPFALGRTTGALLLGLESAGIFLGTSAGPQIRWGNGTPEGNITAPIGSHYHRRNGGAGTSFYVKESGTGNTGWVAK